MIPKIIHYCWFGGNPLPESAKKCIASWRKFLPDYEIKEWNESNFDVNRIPYTREAYIAKNYAYVSDYARMWILYNYGGLYFDTDVEVIRNLDDIISRGGFMGQESDEAHTNAYNGLGLNPGLGLGAPPKSDLIKKILDSYEHNHVFSWTGKITKNIVYRVSQCLRLYPKHDIGNGIFEQGGVVIYPPEYFCPKDYVTGKLSITENTRSIHHFMASWISNNQSVISRISQHLRFIKFRMLGTLKKKVYQVQ